MLHPSYSDLIEAVNNGAEGGEQPVIQSRYSIVIAASKRARELIAGEEPLIPGAAGKKPLSIAVQEIYKQKVKIVIDDAVEEEEAEEESEALREAEADALEDKAEEEAKIAAAREAMKAAQTV